MNYQIDVNGVVIGNETIPEPRRIIVVAEREARRIKVSRDPYHLLVQERRRLTAVGC